MLQDNVFTRFEGDRWFGRNQRALDGFDPAADLPLRLIDLYDLRPRRVLEIGAANGFRLAAIHARMGAAVVGVEPSVEAIRDGEKNFPAVRFVRATASAVPLNERFDLVIMNFVFHWVDRSNLLRTASEVDRLVDDGGFLLIGDFCPSNRLRVRYHHLPDEKVYTYKQNYAATFLACGLYHAVALLTAHHLSKNLDPAVSEAERIGSWLLRKESRGHYVENQIL